MAKQLGIGVRVWVGWVPPDRCNSNTDIRCKTGTITGGPFRPGASVVDEDGARWKIGGKDLMWNVHLDDGSEGSAREYLLHPIDDGDPDAVRERQEKPVKQGVEA